MGVLKPGEEINVARGMKGWYKDEKSKEPTVQDFEGDETLDPRILDDKIKIYERQVKGWFLEPASHLCESDGQSINGFVILTICMAYFEGVEQYKTGVESSNRSKNCFVDSVMRVYPGKFKKEQINELYTQCRCGLFHNGMTKGGVILNSEYKEAVSFEGQGKKLKIKINPELLLGDIRRDFEDYVKKLRQTAGHPELVRENFDRLFSVLPEQQ